MVDIRCVQFIKKDNGCMVEIPDPYRIGYVHKYFSKATSPIEVCKEMKKNPYLHRLGSNMLVQLLKMDCKKRLWVWKIKR